MIYKYIKATIAFFMLAGATSSALFGNNRETLNEISVTGSSIPELDLSRSSILTRNQVEDRQIDNLVDLSGLSPNLHINNNSIQSYGDIITIRGIANTQLFGPAGVQLYIDGIPQADISTYASTLYDVESIEVLRGPQGHKSGKSVTGGAINIKTQSPSEHQTNSFSASYGTFDTQKYNLKSSGPLDAEGFSYSVALQRALSDGFINNSSGNADTSETWHGALKFSLDKGDGTKIGFGGNFEAHELGAQPLVLRGQNDFYHRSTNFDGLTDEITEIERNQQFLTFESDLDDFNFYSITNRNDWEMNPNLVDLDLNNSGLQTSKIIQDQTQWSQEFRIESNNNSELMWVLGIYYSDSEIVGKATRKAPTKGLTETTEYELDSQNFGALCSLEKHITDLDLASIGIRYDYYDKGILRAKQSSVVPGGIPSINKSDRFNSFSPSIQWSRTFSDELQGIARITYCEKPGGFSAYTNNSSQLSFSEEKTFAYEVSLLIKPVEKWGLNLTAFLNEIEDYQFELPDPTDLLKSDYFVANADKVINQGFEVEGYIKPTDNFTFSASYGFCDSIYDKFDGSGLVGKQVSFIPEHTLALSLNYRFDNGAHGQVGTKTIGDTYYWNYAGDNPTDKINSYTLLDANLGFEWKRWKFNVFGTNLTDEEYYTSIVSNHPESPGVAGSPRVIGLSIARDF